MCNATNNVCYGPEADVANDYSITSSARLPITENQCLLRETNFSVQKKSLLRR
jgi:hypothetical protein